MMNVIRWILGLFVAVILCVFAAANRDPVSLVWSPLHPPAELPLYLITLILMSTGFILGSVITWLNTGKLRQTKRKQKKHIRDLEKQLEAVNENGHQDSPPSDFFPALPKTSAAKTSLAKKLGIKR